MSPLAPCGPNELGPVCDGRALVDAGMTAAGSPSPSAATAIVQAGEPTWYYIWDVVGTWLGAIGTLIASGIALWLGLRAVRDQRALQEERDRAQAERVTLVRQWNARGVSILTLRNDSDLAISGVRVATVGQTQDTKIQLGLMPPGATHNFRRPENTDFNVSIVEFIDAAGRTWVRSADGDLYRAWRRDPDRGAVYLVVESASGLVKELMFFPHATGRLRTIVRKQPELLPAPAIVRMLRRVRATHRLRGLLRGERRNILGRRTGEHGSSSDRENGSTNPTPE